MQPSYAKRRTSASRACRRNLGARMGPLNSSRQPESNGFRLGAPLFASQPTGHDEIVPGPDNRFDKDQPERHGARVPQSLLGRLRRGQGSGPTAAERRRSGVARPRPTDPGAQWSSALETALKDSTHFVVLVGEAGLQRWVDREVRYALDRNTGHSRASPSDPDRLPTCRAHYPGDRIRRSLVAELRDPARASSLSVQPSLFLRRVGIYIFTFEAGSSFTRVTACQLTHSPFVGFIARLRPRLASFPARTLASYQVLPTTT